MRTTFLKGLILVLAMLATAHGQAAAPAPAPAAPSVAKPSADAQSWKYFRGAYLGVDIRDIPPDQVAPLKLKSEHGVEITMVDQDAPAAKAGLKEHDVIVAFDGSPVRGVTAFRHMIQETPPGRTVALGISRDGQPMTVQVQLARHKHYPMVAGKSMRVEIPKIHIPDIAMPQFSMLQFSGMHGLLLEDITPQLGEFFGLKDGQGALVRSVENGSAAAAAGLKAGDVIVKAGGERVGCASDWVRVMREHRSGTVALSIMRDKREQSVSLKLPERKTSDASIQITIPDISVYRDELSKQWNELAPQIERSVRIAQADWERMLRDQEKALEQMRRKMERALRERERAPSGAERDRQTQPSGPPAPQLPEEH